MILRMIWQIEEFLVIAVVRRSPEELEKGENTGKEKQNSLNIK
jgi:hypothetical protein